MISTSFKDAYSDSAPIRNEELIQKYRQHLTKLDSYLPKIKEVADFPKKHEWLNTKNG